MKQPIPVSVYDARPYDHEFLKNAAGKDEVAWDFHDFRLSEKTADSAKGSFAVCVFVNDHLNRECLESLAKQGVRLVALRCAGFNNVDLEAAKALSLSIVRVPAYSPHAVAEHTIGLLLCLNRKIHRAYQRVRELNFSLAGLMGVDLVGKTIGIIGTGRIGKITAQIAKGFEMQVLAYDICQDSAWANKHKVEYSDFKTLLTESDIISLHVPLQPETFHLINTATIALMKRGVLIINTSRGKVVDTHAMIQGLKAEQIGGVALDTYEEEEGVFMEDLSNQILLDDELSRLLTFPNVLITAHQGFFTHESLSEIARVTALNILNAAGGRPFLADTCLA